MFLQQEKSSEERSDIGSQADGSDYDVEEEYDNDYAENYFDNGEGDDVDDLGGGGGDDGGGMLIATWALIFRTNYFVTGGDYDWYVGFVWLYIYNHCNV